MFELFKFELFNIDVSSWFDSISIGWGIGLVALAGLGMFFTMRTEKANTNEDGKVRNKATGEQKALAVSRIRSAMRAKHQRTISDAEAYDFLEDLLFYHIIDNLIYGSEEMLYSNMEQHIPEDIGISNEDNGGFEHDTRTEKSLDDNGLESSPVTEETPDIQETYTPEPEPIGSSEPTYVDNSPSYSSSDSDSGSSDGGGGSDD